MCIVRFSLSGGPVHGTRSGVTVLYSVEGPHVERALVPLFYILCAWNALWCHSVIFSVCEGYASGTRSSVIVLHFLRV